MKVLDAPYFCQYSMLSALLILTILLGVLIYLIVALILHFPRSPGEGNGNPLQYSCLENPMDEGAS